MTIKVLSKEAGPNSRQGKPSVKFEYQDQQGNADQILVWNPALVSKVNPGDVCEATFTENHRNGKVYKNLVEIKVTSQSAITEPPKFAAAKEEFQRRKHPAEQTSIARAVALGHGVTLLSHVTTKKDPTNLLNMLWPIVFELEQYLISGQKELEDAVSDVPEVD